MNPTPQPIRVTDPATGRQWSVPARTITRFDADVAERWFINAALPPALFRRIVTAPFLEPDLRDGRIVLSLCRIRMRHGAPDWAPLHFGPATDNCALRVGCIDARDGSPAVWVDRRCTDHVLGCVLKRLGFPPVDPCLEVRRSDDGGLDLGTRDGLVACTAGLGNAPAPRLFASDGDLTTWVAAGVRSYAAAPVRGRFRVIDLEKGSPNAFVQRAGWTARLTTPWGGWDADGVYRTVDGTYQWRVLGTVDSAGNPI
jgi:hypothetical protein